jgi:hypothetical protein
MSEEAATVETSWRREGPPNHRPLPSIVILRRSRNSAVGQRFKFTLVSCCPLVFVLIRVSVWDVMWGDQCQSPRDSPTEP